MTRGAGLSKWERERIGVVIDNPGGSKPSSCGKPGADCPLNARALCLLGEVVRSGEWWKEFREVHALMDKLNQSVKEVVDGLRLNRKAKAMGIKNTLGSDMNRLFYQFHKVIPDSRDDYEEKEGAPKDAFERLSMYLKQRIGDRPDVDSYVDDFEHLHGLANHFLASDDLLEIIKYFQGNLASSKCLYDLEDNGQALHTIILGLFAVHDNQGDPIKKKLLLGNSSDLSLRMEEVLRRLPQNQSASFKSFRIPPQ